MDENAQQFSKERLKLFVKSKANQMTVKQPKSQLDNTIAKELHIDEPYKCDYLPSLNKNAKLGSVGSNRDNSPKQSSRCASGLDQWEPMPVLKIKKKLRMQ